MFSVNETFPVGRLGENIFLELYDNVTDLRTSGSYRARGIDFVYNNHFIDVKTDRHTTGNFFLEVEVLSGEKSSPGAFTCTKAELWWYYFPALGEAYWLDISRTLLHVFKTYGTYPTKTIWSHNTTAKWSANGLLVPVRDLTGRGCARVDETIRYGVRGKRREHRDTEGPHST